MTAARRARRLAALRLAGLVLLGVLLLRIHDARLLAFLLAAVAAASVLAGSRPGQLWRSVRAVVPLVVIVLVAHGVVSGWEHAIVTALRICVLVTAAAAVTLSTRSGDLLAVLTAATRPLRPLGIEPARVALVLAMTMRFVPLIGERLGAIREAQRARGLERPGPSVLPPLLVGTLRLADELADALDARGAADPPHPPAQR